MPAKVAGYLGEEIRPVTASGVGQLSDLAAVAAGNWLCLGLNAVTTSGGAIAVQLLSTFPVGRSTFVDVATTTTGAIFPPSGCTINGGTINASWPAEQNRPLWIVRKSTDFWIIPAGASLAPPATSNTIENRFGFPGPMSEIGLSPKIPQYVGVAQTVPANFAGTGAAALTAGAGSNIFTVSYRRAGANTVIGTVTFSAAGGVTLSTQAAVALQAGDLLFITAPGTPDTTLADFALTILTTRT